MKLTKEMTKPLLADLKEVVNRGIIKKPYVVILVGENLRLKSFEAVPDVSKHIFGRESCSKLIGLVAVAREQKNLVKLTEEFPNIILANLSKTQLVGVSPDVINKLYKRTQELNHALKELQKGFANYQQFPLPLSESFKNYALTLTYQTGYTFNESTGLLTIDGNNYLGSSAKKGVLVSNMVREDLSAEDERIGLHQMLVNPTQNIDIFSAKLSKISSTYSIPVPKLVERLNIICDDTEETYDATLFAAKQFFSASKKLKETYKYYN